MSTIEMRQAVHKYVDQLDEKFLEVVLAMLDTYAKQQPDFPEISGIPATEEEIESSIEKGEEQIVKGEYYTIDELKNKTAQWFNTKS